MIIEPKTKAASADRNLTACLAALVLALATGAPLHSAKHVLPHPGEQAAPYFGV